MYLYRIITEEKNVPALLHHLEEQELDATVIQTSGIWRGQIEPSLIIELQFETEESGFVAVQFLANWIKRHNKQDAVLVQRIDLASAVMY